MEGQRPLIRPEEIKIEIINSTHNVSHFNSYEPELVDFLKEDALDNQQKKISTTYLWFYKPNDELVGYITVLADSINLQGGVKSVF